MKRRLCIVCLCLLVAGGLRAEEGEFMKFMYRVGLWLDDLALKGLDTAYVTIPEFTWRVALTNSEVGIHSTFIAENAITEIGRVQLESVTTPSLDLGFNIGLRTFGFGYSWDALHAYAQKLNLSMGGKSWGVEFSRQKSTNINASFRDPSGEDPEPIPLGKVGDVWITNMNVSAWYAFNAHHYSHYAAVKQSYIQRRTAGSLLINLSYLNTDLSLGNDTSLLGLVPFVLGGVRELVTHQVAAGAGYGINYTPNRGKFLLHASAMAQVVFYTVNYISYDAPDEKFDFAYPSYTIRPTKPVHFTGTMRLAMSWEINKWVHLGANAQVNNIRFQAKAKEGLAELNNWNWQANLAVGVRLGVGRDRINRALGIEPADNTQQLEEKSHQPEQTDGKKLFQLPQWVTDYFFSSRQP